jgi:outer membrane protein assembly factor BamB
MIRTTCTTAIIVGCMLLSVATGARGQDWPQWRGANRDAKATGFEMPKTWPKQLTQKWKVTVGDGVATPSLAGDKLYVFTRQGGDEVIRCLDASTGKELWQDKYATEPAKGTAQNFPGPRCSPTVEDGKVATLGVRGMLSCYDASTGKKLWQKDDFHSWPVFFTSSSPVVVDGLCVAQLGGRDGGSIVAYDLATGDQRWKWTGDSPAYASPELMTVDGTKLIVAQTTGKMLALNAADGKVVWETPFAVQRGGFGYNAVTPVVDGESIIYGGSGRGFRDVKLEKGDAHFDAKELWKNTEKSPIFSSPVLKDGLLYGITQTNEIFCLNAKDGKTLWSAPGPPTGRGRGGRGGGASNGYGSIVDAGPVLIALTPSSQLIVFEPRDKAFKQLAKYKVADTPTFAYPVIAGNRIFVKDRNSVILWMIE